MTIQNGCGCEVPGCLPGTCPNPPREYKKRRKIAVILVDRANYGRLKPVMQAIADHPDLTLQVVCGGTMVLDRFKRPIDVVRADGFPVDAEVWCEMEGSTPATMARGVGLAVQGFTDALERLDPDFVLLIGDRCEALGAAIAAAYTNRCIVHLQGGELSGSIDESARHAISKMSHYHVPATQKAAGILELMGESKILAVGCPSADVAAESPPAKYARRGLLIVYHPTTTHHETATYEVKQLVDALEFNDESKVMLWPNIDAGSNAIHKEIRRSLENEWLRAGMRTNLSPEEFATLLASVKCCVGNSSSFVRDAGFFGTPVVLVGDRQQGRETPHNVVRTICRTENIIARIKEQLDHGPYPPSTLYGVPGISKEIADRLAQIEPYTQKASFYESLRSNPRPGGQQGNPEQKPSEAVR